jgi:2-amino-4-hydroxy-6-hydroxymethyldihydropteridine diphosphokinase
MTLAYVGLGSNIGEPRRHLELAMEELKRLPDTEFIQVSRIYTSAPLGYLHQPGFLNAVVGLDTGLAPLSLLENLLEIEKRHGRERSFANAPRTLDLDLLLYGDRMVSTHRLTIPHPRMHERAFVLKPLLDLDPGVSIPGRGPAHALLAACEGQSVARIDG